MEYKYKYINIVGNMSIRPAPNTNNTPIGSLPINTIGYGNELSILSNGDKWVKIEKGGSAIGWVAVIHAGKPYGELTEVTPENPPDPEPSLFPESFILTDPKNPSVKAEYRFLRVIDAG